MPTVEWLLAQKILLCLRDLVWTSGPAATPGLVRPRREDLRVPRADADCLAIGLVPDLVGGLVAVGERALRPSFSLEASLRARWWDLGALVLDCLHPLARALDLSGEAYALTVGVVLFPLVPRPARDVLTQAVQRHYATRVRNTARVLVGFLSEPGILDVHVPQFGEELESRSANSASNSSSHSKEGVTSAVATSSWTPGWAAVRARIRTAQALESLASLLLHSANGPWVEEALTSSALARIAAALRPPVPSLEDLRWPDEGRLPAWSTIFDRRVDLVRQRHEGSSPEVLARFLVARKKPVVLDVNDDDGEDGNRRCQREVDDGDRLGVDIDDEEGNIDGKEEGGGLGARRTGSNAVTDDADEKEDDEDGGYADGDEGSDESEAEADDDRPAAELSAEALERRSVRRVRRQRKRARASLAFPPTLARAFRAFENPTSRHPLRGEGLVLDEPARPLQNFRDVLVALDERFTGPVTSMFDLMNAKPPTSTSPASAATAAMTMTTTAAAAVTAAATKQAGSGAPGKAATTSIGSSSKARAGDAVSQRKRARASDAPSASRPTTATDDGEGGNGDDSGEEDEDDASSVQSDESEASGADAEGGDALDPIEQVPGAKKDRGPSMRSLWKVMDRVRARDAAAAVAEGLARISPAVRRRLAETPELVPRLRKLVTTVVGNPHASVHAIQALRSIGTEPTWPSATERVMPLLQEALPILESRANPTVYSAPAARSVVEARLRETRLAINDMRALVHEAKSNEE